MTPEPYEPNVESSRNQNIPSSSIPGAGTSNLASSGVTNPSQQGQQGQLPYESKPRYDPSFGSSQPSSFQGPSSAAAGGYQQEPSGAGSRYGQPQEPVGPGARFGSQQGISDVYVSCATGKEGFGIMNELLNGPNKKHFNVRGGFLSQSRACASWFERSGAKMIECDLNVPETVRMNHLQGVQALILIAPSSANRVDQAKTLINLAADANVPLVILISTLKAHRRDSLWARMFWDIEEYLKATVARNRGIKNFVILRSTFLLSNLLLYKDIILRRQQLPLPIRNGYFAPLDAGDLGRAVVAVLSQPEKHFNCTYELTGPKAKNLHGIAKDMTKALGKPIRPVDISIEDARHILHDANMDPSEVDGLMDFYQLIATNALYFVSPDYFTLTGLRGVTVTDYFLYSKSIFGQQDRQPMEEGGSRW